MDRTATQRWWRVALWACLPFAVLGCQRHSHEQLVDQFISEMNAFVTTLAAIDSEEAARSALPVLEAHVERMQALDVQAKSMANPSPAVQTRIDAQLAQQKAHLETEMSRFVGRLVENPNIFPIIEPVLDEWSGLR